MLNESIKPRYKQTELGLIPEDWDLITYEDAFDFLATASYSRSQLSNNEEILYVHYGDIHTKWNHFLDLSKHELPSIECYQRKNFPFIKEGDLIVADASEDYEGICKSVEVKNIGTKKVISGLHTFLLRDKNNKFVNNFKGYINSNNLIKNQFNRLATGLKVYGITKTNLKGVLIPYPKPVEQHAISQVLNETDELISLLNKLIIKKKNIKQGVMQELITGKRRLNGFTKEWKTKKIKELGQVTTGSTPSTKVRDFWNGDIPWVTPTDICDKKNIIETERA